MSEWWTYRPADLLMFSARSHARLFEIHHAAIWPVQLLTLALGVFMAVALWRGGRGSARLALALLGLAWLWVGWAFHWRQYAQIQTAAPVFAAAFALQGLWLLERAWRAPAPATGVRRSVGLALIVFALVGLPLTGLLAGRAWTGLDVFGATPDATVIATLGVLMLVRGWVAWAVPLLWVVVGAITLWTLGTAEAALLPAAAAAAIAGTLWPSRG